MITTFIIFSGLFILMLINKKYKSYNIRKFRFSLFALRDELRMAAIKGDIDEESWVFDHFDKTLSILISEAKYINILYLIILDLSHSNSTEMIELVKKLDDEISKNKALEAIHTKSKQALNSFLKNQMLITINYFVIPIVKPFVSLKRLLDKKNDWLNKLFVFPETSESSRSFHIAV